MAETKGITIDFYGNTVEFDRSLDGVNKALKSVKQELTTLNKQIKLDPSNVEKLEQKFNKLKELQKLLNEQVDMYKKRLAEMDASDVGSAEWQKLTKELQKAETELLKVNQELLKMPTSNVQVLANHLEDAEKKLNKIGGAIEGVGKALAPLSVATGGLIAKGIEYNATLEQQTALFTTLTGSAEEASRVLESIKGDANVSPFDVSSLISANQYLIATGMEADHSREVIMALGDAISATGGGNSELQRMAQNLQQVQNVGKASSMDMKQFAMAGIDIWGILADTTGKTVEELQNSTITFDMIAEALINASQEGGKYAGAMEMQSETLTGMINKLKASIGELLGELSSVLVPIIKDILSQVQEWINKLKNLDEGQKNLITKVGLLVAGLSPALVIIGKLIGSSGLGGLAGTIANFLKSEGFTAWLAQITTALSGTSGGIMDVIKALGSMLNPIALVVGALAVAYATNEDFRKTVNDLVENLLQSLKPAFDSIIAIVKIVIETFGNVLSAFGSVANLVLQALAPSLNFGISVFGKLITIVAQVAQILVSVLCDAINGVVSVVKTLINWVSDLFTKLANTSWGQAFVGVISSITGALQTVIGWVQSAVSWFQSLISTGNQASSTASSVGSSASRYSSSPRGVVYQSGGLGLASGGIGLTANIHVNNNGTPIDEQEITRWVNVMTDQLDVALGRRM